MENIELYNQTFDISRVFKVIKSAGFESHLESREPFPKHIVREFPFLYRKIIGYEKLIFFIHVQKTAGATLTDLVYRGNRHAIYKGIFSEQKLTFDDQLHCFIGFDSAALENKTVFLCGHYNYGELTRSGIYNNESDRVLVTIRDPLEILLSTYNFMRTICTEQPDCLDAIEWEKAYERKILHLSFNDWLSATEKLPKYLTPYHTIFDIDTETNLRNFLHHLLQTNITIISIDNFNRIINNTDLCVNEFGDNIPVIIRNISTKHVTQIPSLNFLSDFSSKALTREKAIYQSLLQRSRYPYSELFVDSNLGRPWLAKTHQYLYPENLNYGLARFIVEYINPYNLLEFGCGLGLLAKAVASQLPLATSYCIEPKIDISFDEHPALHLLNINIFDQLAPLCLNKKFDLVLSIEVAEHISRDRHEFLFDFLAARASRWVVFSAARPGQGGHGHIAERPEEEWRQEWLSRGFIFDAAMTALARNLSDAKNINHRRNLMVFKAPAGYEALDLLESQTKPYLQSILEIVQRHATYLDGNLFYVNLESALGGMPDFSLRIKRNNLMSLAKPARIILEIGFNAGHSALLFLLSNPLSKLTVVDLLTHPYAQDCFDYLNTEFPSRLHLICGDSRTVLESLSGQEFDLIHLDGGKELTITSDLSLTRGLAAPDHVIVIDDTQNLNLNALLTQFADTGHLSFRAFNRMNQHAEKPRWKHKIGRFSPEGNSTSLILSRLAQLFSSSDFQSIYLPPSDGGVPVGFCRAQHLVTTLRTVEDEQIAGAFVEIGVAAGHSSLIAALAVSRFIPRAFWLFDTYEGFEQDLPDEADYQGRSIREYDLSKYAGLDCDVDAVRNKMLEAGIEAEQLFVVKGPIEQTAAVYGPEKIAVLRIDVDLFTPTLAALEAFYDRLVPGGWLIIDDYGHWTGCRDAIDQFFAKRGEQFISQAVDYTCYVARKVCMAPVTFLSDDLSATRYEF